MRSGERFAFQRRSFASRPRFAVTSNRCALASYATLMVRSCVLAGEAARVAGKLRLLAERFLFSAPLLLHDMSQGNILA